MGEQRKTLGQAVHKLSNSCNRAAHERDIKKDYGNNIFDARDQADKLREVNLRASPLSSFLLDLSNLH